jgi:hypothetical protein
VLALAALLAFIFRKPDIEDENEDDDDNDDLVVNEANWEPRALECACFSAVLRLIELLI